MSKIPNFTELAMWRRFRLQSLFKFPLLQQMFKDIYAAGPWYAAQYLDDAGVYVELHHPNRRNDTFDLRAEGKCPTSVMTTSSSNAGRDGNATFAKHLHWIAYYLEEDQGVIYDIEKHTWGYAILMCYPDELDRGW